MLAQQVQGLSFVPVNPQYAPAMQYHQNMQHHYHQYQQPSPSYFGNENHNPMPGYGYNNNMAGVPPYQMVKDQFTHEAEGMDSHYGNEFEAEVSKDQQLIEQLDQLAQELAELQDAGEAKKKYEEQVLFKELAATAYDFLPQIGVAICNPHEWISDPNPMMMIAASKSGSLIYPQLNVTVTGLYPNTYYLFSVSVVPTLTKKFTYIGDFTQWKAVGPAENAELPQIECFPKTSNKFQTGAQWMEAPLNFRHLRLTNSLQSAGCCILPVVTNHAYCFALNVYTFNQETNQFGLTSTMGIPDTEFMAVDGLDQTQYVCAVRVSY